MQDQTLMKKGELDELLPLLSSPRVGERLRAMDGISSRAGRRIERTIDDERVVPILIEGLNDVNRRVQRAAARGLRPWLRIDPDLFGPILSAYATSHFDGGYSHAGLYETKGGAVWIPRFAALKGHAALLKDGNADRYFKFELFVPGQAPRWTGGFRGDAHLVLHFIPEWSYSRQQLIPDFDDRRSKANLREQERYGWAISNHYKDMSLPYAVRVHRVEGEGGHRPCRQLDIACIPASGM